MEITNTDLFADFPLLTLPSDPPDSSRAAADFPLLTLPSDRPESSRAAAKNPRKRRTTKLLRDPTHKPKPAKKPDTSAAEITTPCTECGRRFPSNKALFGHMRCHPERQWRGINPPPSLRRLLTDEDHEVAACLLLLANGPPAPSPTPTAAAASDTTACTVSQPTPEYSGSDREGPGPPTARFECSSCKKVFASHQALGGHRASHKNVKGCYAITKNGDGGEDEMEAEEGCCSGEEMMMMMLKDNYGGHKCSICFRVFSSGQALGGHMRCHWEKAEAPSPRVSGFDLNLAAEDDVDAEAESLPYPSAGLALDLRLGF